MRTRKQEAGVVAALIVLLMAVWISNETRERGTQSKEGAAYESTDAVVNDEQRYSGNAAIELARQHPVYQFRPEYRNGSWSAEPVQWNDELKACSPPDDCWTVKDVVSVKRIPVLIFFHVELRGKIVGLGSIHPPCADQSAISHPQEQHLEAQPTLAPRTHARPSYSLIREWLTDQHGLAAAERLNFLVDCGDHLVGPACYLPEGSDHPLGMSQPDGSCVACDLIASYQTHHPRMGGPFSISPQTMNLCATGAIDGSCDIAVNLEIDEYLANRDGWSASSLCEDGNESACEIMKDNEMRMREPYIRRRLHDQVYYQH